MTRIEWSDDYKLGLPAIDSDHEELVGLCNEFLDTAESGAAIAELSRILDRLIMRTHAHFKAEERMLDRHNYPGLAVHKSEHERLLAEANTLKTRYQSAQQGEELSTLTTEASDFLRVWLLDHIRNNDRPYRPFIMTLT